MKHRKVEDTYLFGRDVLLVFKYMFPFIGLVPIGFSLVFLPQAIYSADNRGAGIAATAFFLALGMFFILFSRYFYNLSTTQYVLNESGASNHGKVTVSVSTELPVYTSLLPLLFNGRGGGIIQLPVYLVSNTPIPNIPRYGTLALDLAKKAMDLGIVVLPVNEKTTDWIRQATNITPPEYPKVAYIQK